MGGAFVLINSLGQALHHIIPFSIFLIDFSVPFELVSLGRAQIGIDIT